MACLGIRRDWHDWNLKKKSEHPVHNNIPLHRQSGKDTHTRARTHARIRTNSGVVPLESVQVVFHYRHISSPTLTLLKFDSAAGQGDRINRQSFGGAITVGYHTKWVC